MKIILVALLATILVTTTQSATTRWPVPRAVVVPEADGYVDIVGAAVPPQKSRVYRVVFDATRGPEQPTQLVPALNMAGSELNALGAIGAPLDNAKFVVVFHGAAINGILTDSQYRAKFGVANPNLKVLAKMRKLGVELFVCGQNLAFDNIDPKAITPEVRIASDALLVLMTYQNNGYALLNF